jgi:hypothetical protein
MANDGRDDPRERLLALLLDKVAEDPYPSSTMLDVIERLMRPEDLDSYASVLSDKIAGDTFPSMSMIQRLVTVLGA